MEGYGYMIENVIKGYLANASTELKAKKEDLRIIINPQGDLLKIHLYNKGELVKKLTIDKIIAEQ